MGVIKMIGPLDDILHFIPESDGKWIAELDTNIGMRIGVVISPEDDGKYSLIAIENFNGTSVYKFDNKSYSSVYEAAVRAEIYLIKKISRRYYDIDRSVYLLTYVLTRRNLLGRFEDKNGSMYYLLYINLTKMLKYMITYNSNIFKRITRKKKKELEKFRLANENLVIWLISQDTTYSKKLLKIRAIVNILK